MRRTATTAALAGRLTGWPSRRRAPSCSPAAAAAARRHGRRQQRRQRRPLRDHGGHDPDRRPLRHLRLQGGRPLGRLQEGLPQHHDQGGRRRAVGRLLDAAEDPPRRRAAASTTCRRSRSASSPTSCRTTPTSSSTGTPCPNAAADKAEFYPWKWQLATTSDGTTTVGLGTDIGPEAICYRSDLLKQAGLPVRPADPRRRSGPRGTTSSTSASSTRRRRPSPPARTSSTARPASSPPPSTRATTAYANADGEPDVENSDGVKNAWGYATQAAQDGITAGLQQFTPAWNKAFSSGAFAALACPTWMMGYIQGQAGDAYAGKWNIAPVLPGGATNWGGSWLGVPTDGQEPGRRHRAGRVAVGQGPAGHDVDRARAATSRPTPTRRPTRR